MLVQVATIVFSCLTILFSGLTVYYLRRSEAATRRRRELLDAA